MRKFIRKLFPPGRWRIPVIITLGTFCGLAVYTVYISRAPSYLSDKPEVCVNCHIMAPQYATWNHSAHREYATCVDCHVPHDNVFNYYYFKAKDGLRHAYVFTLRKEPQVIFIKEEGKKAVQQNCERCHEFLVEEVENEECHKYPCIRDKGGAEDESERYCWECHRATPHGRVNSLSSVPNARVPVPESPVPEWLKKSMKNEIINKSN